MRRVDLFGVVDGIFSPPARKQIQRSRVDQMGWRLLVRRAYNRQNGPARIPHMTPLGGVTNVSPSTDRI